MKTNIFNIVLSILLGVNGIILYNKKNVIEIESPRLATEQIPKNVINDYQNTLAEYQWAESKTNFQTIPPSLKIGANNTNQQLKDILHSDGTLIFRYKEIHCNICVDSTITLLNKISKQLDSKERINYLGSYGNERDLAVFKRINQIDNAIYNLPEAPFHCEYLDRPYLIFLDEKSQVRQTLIVDKDFLKRTKAFLSSVKIELSK